MWRRRARTCHRSVLEAVEVVEVVEAIELDPLPAHLHRGGPVRQHHVRASARHSRKEAAAPTRRHGRVEWGHPGPGGHGPEEGVREGHGVADGETDGAEAPGTGVAEQGPPALHAPLELTEGQRPPVTGVLDEGPLSERHRAPANDITQREV